MASPTMATPVLMTGLETVKNKWAWFVGLGALLMLGGIIALGANIAFTLVTMMLLAWILIFSGIAEAFSAFYMRSWGGVFLHLIGAALDLVLGYLFLTQPATAAAVITLFLACLFFVGGSFRIFASLTSQFPGWGWSLFSGLINVVLGVLLINQWPFDALWFIGFCVGLELLFRGWFWMMLGLSLRKPPVAMAA